MLFAFARIYPQAKANGNKAGVNHCSAQRTVGTPRSARAVNHNGAKRNCG